MNIKSAQFVKGIVGPDEELEKSFPQIAFVGRSNVGKSSLINSLVGQKKLAKTSNTPGRTQQINLFLINDSVYFLDLPGYGYAKISKKTQLELGNIISGYLFEAPYCQAKIVLVIDAKVGPTEGDLQMLKLLEESKKNILVVVNKVDKIRPSEYEKQMNKIQKIFKNYSIIPFSSEKKIGREKLLREIL